MPRPGSMGVDLTGGDPSPHSLATGQPAPLPGAPQRLRVGLVGAGMISVHHLVAWSQISDAEVVAIADPNPDSAKGRAGEFGIARTYPSLSALLAAETVDALDIAAPREAHSALVREAADAGLSVLCQKPLAPTLEEAEALVRDVGGRIRLMVHENWRFRPYYRRIRDRIDAGCMGHVDSCSIAVKSSGLLPGADGRYPTLNRQPFMQHEKRLIVAEVLIHHIDVARWLFGPLQLLAARLRRTSSAVVGETAASLLFETRRHAPVFIEGNLTCPGFPPAPHDRVEIIGGRASILMENNQLHLLGADAETIRYEHASAYQESFDRAIAHFVHCVHTGAPFETGADDNLDTLRLVESAYLAALGRG